ncbi:MAG: CoA ester lyase [Parasphingorhabdus sp.]|uniref:HpcH/HpaI aldolase/citrate lyase family protein n=1 Tax=Parasphingorhabdus sp. TaxID=2709688 RepID=UPI0030015DDA
MKLRSLLFVPGDRPERFSKAVASGADAIILDLEDSVSTEQKPQARLNVAKYLAQPRKSSVLVRINPLDSGLAEADLAAILSVGSSSRPDGLMLPKAEDSKSVEKLIEIMGDNAVPILPIASETPAAVFGLGSYKHVSAHLMGLTWGAEDLPAAIGAASSREDDGRYTSPYEMVRALTLFGAHAAGVPAIETVFPAISDTQGLADYIARGRRDGFTGMMAIHPAQVEAINSGFAPSAEELANAKKIVAAFAAQPNIGALSIDGKMIDYPHLVLARKLLERAE